MKINEKTRAYLCFCKSLLGYKRLVTAGDLILNVVLFSYMAATAVCVRQILNTLDGEMGLALSLSIPWLIGMVIATIIRVFAIMGCAALDAKRAYYYQNRIRLNALNSALSQRDVTRVSGDVNHIFEILDDDVCAATFPAELITEVSGYTIYTLISLGILLYINWMVTLLIFIPLSLALIGISRMSQNMKERRRASRDSHDAASAFLGDITEAAVEIKQLGASEGVLKRYDRIYDARRMAIEKDAKFNERVLALLYGATYVGTSIMMLFGAKLMLGGSMSLGDFSIFVTHLGTLSNCIERIVELFVYARKAEVSYERLVDNVCIGDVKALTRKTEISIKPIKDFIPERATAEKLRELEVRDLCFSYEGVKVLDNISFTLYPKQLMVISGGVASGKSTLVSVLNGALPYQSGDILYNGKPLSDSLRPWSVSGTVQRGGVFSDGMYANIELNQNIAAKSVDGAIEVSAMKNVYAEHGNDTDIGDRGDKLSGGQKQRLLLARVLARESEVSILDDCVSALDYDTKTAVLNSLINYIHTKNKAMIIATNDEDFISKADIHINLKKSEVVQRKERLTSMYLSAALHQPHS